MPLTKLDHVNIRTADLDRSRAFYRDILGMGEGWRPNFPFDGAWMYLDGHPFVHLVDVKETPAPPEALSLEHFAFSATDMDAFLAVLKTANIPYRLAEVPGTDITQVNLHDPDGNHLHVDFQRD